MLQRLAERIAQIAKPILESMKRRIGPIASDWHGRAMRRLDPIYQQARARYQKLERREKLLVQIAAALVALLAVYNLIYLPIRGLRADLEDSVRSHEAELTEVRRLAATYARLKLEVSAAERRTAAAGGKDFSLFAVLEGTLTASVGRDKIGAITPAEKKISRDLVQYTVDLKLSDVSLPQIVDALYGVKTLSVPVTVASLNIRRRFQTPHSYDVELTCSVLGRNG